MAKRTAGNGDHESIALGHRHLCSVTPVIQKDSCGTARLALFKIKVNKRWTPYGCILHPKFNLNPPSPRIFNSKFKL